MELVPIYAGETPPSAWRGSLFLAGPTPREAEILSWRPAALELIAEHFAAFPGRLVVFVPELRSGLVANYDGQIAWEYRAMSSADVLLFWVPREMTRMPALTTNVEFGRYENSGRMVLGTPPNAPHTRYLRSFATGYAAPICSYLSETVAATAAMLGPGAERAGGECEVPALVWNTPVFQSWYGALRAAGNTLLGGRLLYVLRLREGQAIFAWLFRARIYLAAEDRIKEAQMVFGRPDTSAVVAYLRKEPVLSTEVVLIREFRAAVANEGGYVHELPGGSSADPCLSPHEVAAAEFSQETGLSISPERLAFVSTRQAVATLSAHRQAVFALELSEAEMAQLRADQSAHGNAAGTERTYLEIATLREILGHSDIDWSNAGAISSVLLDEDRRL